MIELRKQQKILILLEYFSKMKFTFEINKNKKRTHTRTLLFYH
jgi:hypothetical protein